MWAQAFHPLASFTHRTLPVRLENLDDEHAVAVGSPAYRQIANRWRLPHGRDAHSGARPEPDADANDLFVAGSVSVGALA